MKAAPVGLVAAHLFCFFWPLQIFFMSLKKKDHGGDGEIGWRLRWLPYRVCLLQVALALTYSGQGKMYERLTGGGGWSGGLW